MVNLKTVSMSDSVPHTPLVLQRGAVLYVNPGSAGPRRFRLPVSIAELVIENGKATARIVELQA